MRNYNKLCSLFCTAMYLHQQCKLSLRWQRSFRLVKKIQTIWIQIILCQCEKTFSMWFFMIFSGRMLAICIFFFLRCNVIKTFRSKKISPPFLPVTFWNSYGIIQFWMRIMRRKNIILCSSPLKAPIADAKTAGSLVIWPPACYLFNQYFNFRQFPALISPPLPGR